MEGSFEGFVAARGPDLWRAAWLLTGDSHKAEDLVQTALMKTYSRYRGSDQQYEAYVRTTMYRTYISWWRRRWRGEIPAGDELPPGAAAMSDDGDPHLSIDVARSLAGLPPKQRAVLVLRYFEDRTIAQTAAALGLAEGTVKAYSHAGLAALRTCRHLVEES